MAGKSTENVEIGSTNIDENPPQTKKFSTIDETSLNLQNKNNRKSADEETNLDDFEVISYEGHISNEQFQIVEFKQTEEKSKKESCVLNKSINSETTQRHATNYSSENSENTNKNLSINPLSLRITEIQDKAKSLTQNIKHDLVTPYAHRTFEDKDSFEGNRHNQNLIEKSFVTNFLLNNIASSTASSVSNSVFSSTSSIPSSIPSSISNEITSKIFLGETTHKNEVGIKTIFKKIRILVGLVGTALCGYEKIFSLEKYERQHELRRRRALWEAVWDDEAVTYKQLERTERREKDFSKNTIANRIQNMYDRPQAQAKRLKEIWISVMQKTSQDQAIHQPSDLPELDFLKDYIEKEKHPGRNPKFCEKLTDVELEYRNSPFRGIRATKLNLIKYFSVDKLIYRQNVKMILNIKNQDGVCIASMKTEARKKEEIVDDWVLINDADIKPPKASINQNLKNSDNEDTSPLNFLSYIIG